MAPGRRLSFCLRRGLGRSVRSGAALATRAAARRRPTACCLHLHTRLLTVGGGYPNGCRERRGSAALARDSAALDRGAQLQRQPRLSAGSAGRHERALASDQRSDPAARYVSLPQYDAIVVGAGPNGLVAAVVLARSGLRVLVREASDTPGGGARTEPLTLPGFAHDVCSAVHPLGIGSPILRALPLARHGLAWVHPSAPLAHPLDDASATLLERDMSAMDAQLGSDASRWRALFEPFVHRSELLFADVLGPLKVPRHPLLTAGFGLRGLCSTTFLTRRVFRGERARSLFGGMAAHATLPLGSSPSAAFGMILGIAGHAYGWPLARGGSAAISRALVSYLRSLDGELRTGEPVSSLDDLPAARVVLLDLTPRQILRLGCTNLPARYRAQLENYQYGLGTFKVDWALAGPIPWRDPHVGRAGTVHLGGSLREIEQSRQHEWAGKPAERPYVLLVQPTRFDPTRAPAGRQVGWAYCHVPNGSTADMTERIEAQVERFAPGFRDRILARHVMGPAELEQHNANLVGGDINGGEASLRQLFFRPTVSVLPYATPDPRLFVCSSSTPPGGGVHGMGGYHAARLALRRRFGR
ncbi:MAG: NAD(P)/FAD-dependent oxidoreductase [Chloroflexi bacterium]|nr:NAD(P)/FAD-dependent oxidoreductase [Chloroflexota bacterium]